MSKFSTSFSGLFPWRPQALETRLQNAMLSLRVAKTQGEGPGNEVGRTKEVLGHLRLNTGIDLTSHWTSEQWTPLAPRLEYRWDICNRSPAFSI